MSALPSERSGERDLHPLKEQKWIEERAAAMGIKPEDLQPADEGHPWITHKEYVDKDPGRLERAVAAEGAAKREWAKTHDGSLDGYVPGYPCGGTLRMTDLEDGRKDVSVECDGCSIRMAISRTLVDGTAAVVDLIRRAQLPELFVGKRMDVDAEQAQAKNAGREYLEWWSRREKPEDVIPAPAFYGKVGIGKTHLVVSLTETLIKRHALHAVYWSMSELLARLRDSFDSTDKKDAGNDWRRAVNIDLLVLDDIGAEQLTPWAQEQMGILIDFRYRNLRPILLSSNMHPDEWPELFGERAASRLRGLVLPIEMKGEDRRQRLAEQREV